MIVRLIVRMLLKIRNFNIHDYILVIVIFLSLGTFYPAMWNHFVIGRNSVIFQIVFILIWFLCVFIKRSKLSNPSPTFVYLLVSSTIYYALHALFCNDDFAYLVTYVESIIVVLLAHNSFKGKVFMKILLYANAIMLIFTIIGSILAYMNMLMPSVSEVHISQDSAVIQNYRLFFTKVSTEWDSLIIRSCGYFDEPGSFAHVTFLLLCYNKLHLKNKWLEFIFLFGGLFTLSAAHIIISVLYIILFYINKQNILSSILIVSVAVIIIVAFSKLQSNNNVILAIKDSTLGRIENIINGEDGSRDYETSKNAFKYYFPFGTSINDLENNFPNATKETFWCFIARYGLFGTLILYLPIILIFLKYFKKGIHSPEIKLLVLFLVFSIQRPNFYSPLYLVIIYYTWYYRYKSYDLDL